MYSSTALWLTGFATLLIGAGLGVITANWLRRASAHSRRALEQQLEILRAQQRTYRNEVNEHFQKTAQLLNQLTSNYREVHNHLADGASQLCDITPALEAFPPASGPLTIDQDHRLENPEPPRDYAPRTGALAEDYGLDKDDFEPSIIKSPPTVGA